MGLYVIIGVYFGNYPIPFPLDIREIHHLKIDSCSMPAEISYSATYGLGSFSEDNSPKMLLFHLSIQHKGVIHWLYSFVVFYCCVRCKHLHHFQQDDHSFGGLPFF